MESILLLNFSYEPLRLIDVQRAMKLLVRGKAEIARDPDTGQLHVAEGRHIASAVKAFPLPTIVRMLYYVTHKRQRMPLTKKNVLQRDDFACAYCGRHSAPKTLTVDHVVPRSRGGKSSWENLVACCQPCNARKANRTPAEAAMPLRRSPYEPRFVPTVVLRSDTYCDTWGKYVTLYRVAIEQRPNKKGTV
jgi:5-methylcytosine-specific restriction endonuclease McrA